jgi:hypothetical protein
MFSYRNSTDFISTSITVFSVGNFMSELEASVILADLLTAFSLSVVNLTSIAVALAASAVRSAVLALALMPYSASVVANPVKSDVFAFRANAVTSAL